MTASAETVNVTGIIMVVDGGAETDTEPLYTPGANPAGFAAIVKVAGVVPLVGATTESQFPVDEGVAV